MAGNVLIKNANGKTVTLQNPDTNFADVVVDTSNITELADFIGSNQSLTGSGYQKLPGGLIVQWGSVITGGGGGAAITFPISFTTSAYHISGSCDVVSVQPLILNFSNPSTTASAVYVSNGAGSGIGSIGIRYIVIGY